MTIPEKLLWSKLRSKQALFKFRRQHPIAGCITDFCCTEAGLVIEVDGRTHDDRQAADLARDEKLRANGFRVFRVSNDAVLKDLAQVVDAIYFYCENPNQEPHH